MATISTFLASKALASSTSLQGGPAGGGPGLDPHNGVVLRIETGGAAQRPGGDAIGLDTILGAIELALHDIGEEGRKPQCGGKIGMGQDMPEMAPDLFGAGPLAAASPWCRLLSSVPEIPRRRCFTA